MRKPTVIFSLWRWEKITYFPLQGRYNYRKLNPLHRRDLHRNIDGVSMEKLKPLFDRIFQS